MAAIFNPLGSHLGCGEPIFFEADEKNSKSAYDNDIRIFQLKKPVSKPCFDIVFGKFLAEINACEVEAEP